MSPMSPRLLRPRAPSGRYRPLRVDLVAYWPLNETATSGDVTAEDWTKRGNNLASNNSVLSVSGLVGSGREFVSANSEWLSANASTDLQLGNGNWTLTLWFWRSSLTGEQMLAAKDVSGAREFNITSSQFGTTTNVGTTLFNTSGNARNITASNAQTASAWNFVALRHVASTGVVTVRGNSATGTYTRTGGEEWATANTPWNIGRRGFSGANAYLNGYVDEVAKWNRALSDAELNTLYNNGAGIDLRQ